MTRVDADSGGRVDELWSDEFEVLHWVVERFEHNGRSVEVGEALRVFPEEHYDNVRESLRRLSSHTYPVAVHSSGPRRAGRPAAPVAADTTGGAVHGVDRWPDNVEVLADRMLAVLVEGAVTEPDPEKRYKLKAGLEGVGGMTRDLLVSVLAAAVARSTGTAWP
jgi:phosphoglycolate phosphatase-like HAD superfamily hydrolase